jgi:hypothetical protein
MKRKDIVNKLLSEGFSSKFISNLTDKQLNSLSKRVLSEETLNIPKDDQQAISNAKQNNKTFETYEDAEVGKTTKCKKCDHSWKVESKDNHPDLCHSCGWDGKKKSFDKKSLKKWKDEQSELNEWVEGLVKDKYHTDTTTKKEIYEMIGALSDSADRLVASQNMFDVDEQSPEPSKPDTDTPTRERPTTKPGKPKRENPFAPKHKPKPKAKLPKSLTFDSIGLKIGKNDK